MRAKRDLFALILLVMGALSILNGLWMLIAPMSWYTDLPAAIPDYGPFNRHFVRDIGCAFFAFGAGLVWSAFRAAYRLPMVALATLFYGMHALIHVHCSITGCVSAEHWLLDTPGVYLPTLLLCWLSIALWRQGARASN